MATALDDEIAALQARADALRSQVKIQTSALLSSASTHKLLADSASQAGTKKGAETGDASTSLPQDLLSQVAAQQAHNQQSLYRACASITTFRVRDPDPHAVDGGSVLGIRFEVVRRGRFLRPYYVLLNRPYVERSSGGPGGQNDDDALSARRRFLRVHRHTVPTCIPLSGLAARYLPPPLPLRTPANDGPSRSQRPTRHQDLPRFVRTLRRELVRYHSRMAGVADLRRAVGLRKQDDGAASTEESEHPSGLVDVSPADSEAKQIKLEWEDGQTGRLVVNEDGEIVKLVVYDEMGRNRSIEQELLGKSTHLGDLVGKLASENDEG